MGLRVRKTIKLFPGVKINLSKSGISTTAGVKGATITHGHGKKCVNMGIPGSGISHTSITRTKADNIADSSDEHAVLGWLIIIGVVVVTFWIFL